jgi:hypothetical protein
LKQQARRLIEGMIARSGFSAAARDHSLRRKAVVLACGRHYVAAAITLVKAMYLIERLLQWRLHAQEPIPLPNVEDGSIVVLSGLFDRIFCTEQFA